VIITKVDNLRFHFLTKSGLNTTKYHKCQSYCTGPRSMKRHAGIEGDEWNRRGRTGIERARWLRFDDRVSRGLIPGAFKSLREEF
jgi:hypothetical protein